MIQKTIKGKLIKLTPITPEFTPCIVKWRNNPRVMHNFRFDEPFTTELHDRWMVEMVETGMVVQHIIRINDTGLPIGSVYFRDINTDEKTAEFGIFIGEDTACGHGYGNEATSLYTTHGITELGLKKIFLRVFEDNSNAIKCYKKAGYIQMNDKGEDIICTDGSSRHMIHMSLSVE